MTKPSDDVIYLPDLEPLEADGEPAVEDYTELIRAFDDATDLDDSTALDLDPGITLPDGESPVDQGPDLSLDLGDLIAENVERRTDDGADEYGPLGDVAGRDLGDDDELFAHDDDEDSNDPIGDLIDEELPPLDGDPDADGDGALSDDEDPLAGSEEALEEDPPGHAELPWVAVPLADVEEPRHIVTVRGDTTVAIGTDGASIDADDIVTRLSGMPKNIVSALVEADERTLVVATATGELLRVFGVKAREPLTYRDEEPMAAKSTLRLGGPTPSGRPALLLHVASPSFGALFESTNRGTTWRRVDLGGRVNALSTGTPPVCLVEAGDSLRLYRSSSSGGFTAVGSEWPFDPDRVELSSDGDVVAVLERGNGVHVSSNGGAVYHRVKGTSRATAITTGRLDGRPSAFAALYRPASGRSALVWIDANSAVAFVLGEVLPTVAEEDEEDFALVSSIAWSQRTETLWVAGKFGLRRWRRPSSA